MEKITTKLYSDVGMGELFMSRLFHFQDNILSGVFGLKNTKEIKESILAILFEGLEPAFRSLRNLRKEWVDEKIPEKKKRQDIENIYSYLTRAFQDRFQATAKLIGYDIGFFFQNDNAFKSGCVSFLNLHPKINPDFVEMLENDRSSWFNLLNAVRNYAIEHPADKDPALIKHLESYMNLDFAEIVFDNCWRAIEDLLAIFANDKTDPKYGMAILELKEYRDNKNNLQRFGWFIIDKETDKKIY